MKRIIATLLVLVGTSAMIFATTTDCKAAKAPVETTADATADVTVDTIADVAVE
ncbi:MAG: hypothetical protein J6B11_02650 [Spirochaetales bacterium]|nr:hypothetical protein [Spirochaetales bacterium]